MMIMNGFPIGFFFPKQDYVQPETKDYDRYINAKRNSKAEDVERDVEASLSGFSLYAYRFF